MPFNLKTVSCCVLVVVLIGATVQADDKNEKNVLFIGNSYTARHKLPQLVKSMAEAADPDLSFRVETVIYGGRRLADHWRLGTANFVRLHELTQDEQKATIASLEKAVTANPDDKYAAGALRRHRELLGRIGKPWPKWDVVVLQSYRDDVEGSESLYAQFAPRFAELAKAQGARVVLYETSPTTQNAQPLKSAPDAAPVMKKAKEISALAKRIEAKVAPMSLIAFRCQTERPDFTLRFINDAHLNQTMAYLSACAIYSAIFDRSPVGLPIDSVTDIRFFKNKDRTKDRDGKPITRVFSAKDRADLQRIAWEGIQQLQQLDQ